MNREEAPGKSPEDMYIQQKVRVLLMLKKMGSNVSMMDIICSIVFIVDGCCFYKKENYILNNF